jgi:cell division protein FtsB
MTRSRNTPAFGATLFFALMVALAVYFLFAAVQGAQGIFARVVVEAEIADRTLVRDALAAELAQIENRTRRLSDGSIDLDLLDEQARAVLGLMRPDEIAIR